LLRRFIEGKEDPGENENLLRLESERDAVQLMTMHAAKGLEFPIVFLFGGLTGSQKNTIQFYHDAAENPIIDLLNSKIPEEHEWQVEAEQQRLLYVAMTRACGRLYLPCVGYLQGNSGKRICKVGSGYSMLNEQLSIISEQIVAEKHNYTFSRSIVGTSAVNFDVKINATKQEKLREWKLPELPEIPESLNETANPQRLFSQLRFEKRGFVLSSFSRMSRKNKEQNADKKRSIGKEISIVEIRTDTELGLRREDDEGGNMLFSEIPAPDSGAESEFTVSNVRKDPLPGGPQTGNLLHELLESVDFSVIRESKSSADWLALTAVRRIISSINERYGRSAETESRIAEIIWNSLRTPLRLGNNPDAPELELADIKKDLREADFYFPIPHKEAKVEVFQDIGHAGITDSHSEIHVEGWTIDKGFLRGSIDFLFEHEAKIYLLDWKSNLLKNYGQESVEQEVIQNYELQLQIYTLAISYWFKLDSEEKYNEKFGGAVYLFLRGIGVKSTISRDSGNSINEGVYFKRPTWQELKAYETRLSLEKY
jgi:exodeoxyribonuclease V beta subunit